MKKPPENGLYWLYRKDAKPTVVRVYDIDIDDPSVAFLGTDFDKLLSEVDGEWIGPIIPPPHVLNAIGAGGTNSERDKKRSRS